MALPRDDDMEQLERMLAREWALSWTSTRAPSGVSVRAGAGTGGPAVIYGNSIALILEQIRRWCARGHHVRSWRRSTRAVVVGGRRRTGRLGYGNTSDIGDNEAPAAAGPVDVGGSIVQLAAGGGDGAPKYPRFRVPGVCRTRGTSGASGKSLINPKLLPRSSHGRGCLEPSVAQAENHGVTTIRPCSELRPGRFGAGGIHAASHATHVRPR